MLQEMGVTVWDPAPAAMPTTQAPAAPSVTAVAAPAVAPSRAPDPVRATPDTRAAAQTTSAPPPTTAPTAPALTLHAAQALYPTADPAQTPADLGSGWLIVAESLAPADPLGGDAGRLLDNMLRAMQLHKHPRVFLAALERPGPGSSAQASADIPATLADTVATLKPAMVLVLGHVAARAALGRTEPLGRLRAGPHQLAGSPAVVTYDPAFLLRSQDTKAAAWADLCHALALVRSHSAV